VRVQLINHQRRDPVPLRWLGQVARRAAHRLGVQEQGTLMVSLIGSRAMRAANRKFLRHQGLTDVLSFRYPNEAVAGEILIAPAAARQYAKRHGIPYRQELARYVLHGLLHWLGHEDRTSRQQRRMRALEDKLLAQCARD